LTECSLLHGRQRGAKKEDYAETPAASRDDRAGGALNAAPADVARAATGASERQTRDRTLLYATAFVRAFGVGMVGVLLGIYLARLAFPPAVIGWIVGAGLCGVAAASFLATLAGDRLGRRRFLVALALLGAAGGAGVALSSHAAVIGVAAFLGMVNGMGRDRGAALVLEQAMLPATTTDATRTRAFAVYNVVQDTGHALGGLAAGLPALLHRTAAVPEIAALQFGLALYVCAILATGLLYLLLSPAIEIHRRSSRISLSPTTRGILWRISALFSLDSLGGGFLTAALLSFFFFERFHAGEGTISLLFFGARVMNALSHLGAAWLARRIGLVNTMVFTHIPSSFLLLTVPFAPSFVIAAVLFLLREGLVEMDVPTRQSYVMAVVRPEERTVASGVTNLVRTAAWAVAPSFAGIFMQRWSLGAPLLVGATMKVAYDVLLYRAFRGLKPPEEQTH
jgi:MFS family permease